jgi:tetratricopeptide (TPR) repeat protein
MCPGAAGFYALSLLLFAFALMSKPMLVTLPLLMVVLDFWPLRRIQISDFKSQISTFLLLEKIPFFLLSAASCVITFQVQKAGGAVAGLQQLPLAARVSNSIVSYLRYLGELFWPSGLAVLYPFQAWPIPLVLLSALALIILTLLAVWQRQKRPYLLAGWAWYIVSLVPVIGLVQVGAQSIADRYTYLPCIGLCFALVWALSDALGGRKSGGFALVLGATASLLALAVATQKQILFWQNTERLFTHAVSVTSRNALAYNTLGRYFATYYEWRQAEESYRTAIKIDPSFQQAWNNLGCALIDQGRNDEAITNCLIAIQLGSSFAEAHNNLGTALLNLGKTDEAITAYSQALKLRPQYEQAHYNLGNALALKGRIPEALEQYEAALEINPRSASAHNNCGFMLAKEGQCAQATTEFRTALALDPALWQAHYGLGDALARLGQHAAAAAEFTELLKVRPNDAAARRQLAVCQAAQDNTK